MYERIQMSPDRIKRHIKVCTLSIPVGIFLAHLRSDACKPCAFHHAKGCGRGDDGRYPVLKMVSFWNPSINSMRYFEIFIFLDEIFISGRRRRIVYRCNDYIDVQVSQHTTHLQMLIYSLSLSLSLSRGIYRFT